MPGWSGALGTNVFKTYGLVASTSAGTILTGVTAQNSKSPYTPLCQSLEFNASGMLIDLSINSILSGNTTDFLVDVAVGAAGSEVDIIRNLYITSGAHPETIGHFIFDRLLIPAGSRLSARYQVVGPGGNATGSAIDISLIPFHDDISDVLSLGRTMTYGVLPTLTKGAIIDPGAGANTPGAWTALVTSALEPVRSMIIANAVAGNNALTAGRSIIDIGVGAAGQEIVLFSYGVLVGSNNDLISPPVIGPLHVNIPAGTRIAARAQSSITDASDRLINMIIYCMD